MNITNKQTPVNEYFAMWVARVAICPFVCMASTQAVVGIPTEAKPLEWAGPSLNASVLRTDRDADSTGTFEG